jgi:hypothetical protein
MAIHGTHDGGARQGLKRLADNGLDEYQSDIHADILDEETEVSNDGDSEDGESFGLTAFTDLLKSHLGSPAAALSLFVPKPVMQFCAIAH